MTQHSDAQGTALLLCNGEPPPRALLHHLGRSCELLVAADGGANSALKLGIRPDVIIGDMDSVAASTLRAFRHAHIVRVSRQDTTDMEKALDFLRHLKFRKILLVGATGRRLDMTLANLAVLWRYVPQLNITVVGNGWYAVPVMGSCRLRARTGTIVSILPGGPCSGVTVRGLQYPLTRASLGIGAVGVSNVVRLERFTVTIRKGRALVIVMESLRFSSGEVRAGENS